LPLKEAASINRRGAGGRSEVVTSSGSLGFAIESFPELTYPIPAADYTANIYLFDLSLEPFFRKRPATSQEVGRGMLILEILLCLSRRNCVGRKRQSEH
ncbi:unnamed protein product, partial [Nesidiocoris tenuis]